MVRILFPTDFSPPSSNAFRYACGLAKLINGKINVVFIYRSETMGGSMLSLKDIKNTEKVVRKNFFDKMDVFIGKENEGIVSGKKIIFGDSVAEGIVNSVSALTAHLIVMGINSTHNLLEKMFGSITSDVILKSPVPLFIVPEKVTFKTIKKLVFATDFEKKEKGIWMKLDKWADSFGVSVEVVHVGKNKGYSRASDDFEKFYNKHGGVQLIDAPTVLEGLNNYLLDRHADILALFKPRRGFFEKLAKPSRSRSILFEACLPILVLTNSPIEI